MPFRGNNLAKYFKSCLYFSRNCTLPNFHGKDWAGWAWTSPNFTHAPCGICWPQHVVEPAICFDRHSNNNFAILLKNLKNTSLKMEVAGRKVPSPVIFYHLNRFILFFCVCLRLDLPFLWRWLRDKGSFEQSWKYLAQILHRSCKSSL